MPARVRTMEAVVPARARAVAAAVLAALALPTAAAGARGSPLPTRLEHALRVAAR